MRTFWSARVRPSSGYGSPTQVGQCTIELGKALSFDGVRKTVEEIGVQLSAAWDRVKPSQGAL